MHWIHHYQLFLFDFDGILADTEPLHFNAYKQMCQAHGFSLEWDLKTYALYASMYGRSGLKKAIYHEFPTLMKHQPSWDVLYREKTLAYLELLETQTVSLMPGIEFLLQALNEANIKRAVVTNSPKEQIALIRQKQPLLNTIPLWITREQYSEPKPASECYEKAIGELGEKGDRIIGFEDSPRGLRSLLGTRAEGVFVTPLMDSEQAKQLSLDIGRDFPHFSSFVDLLKVWQ
ncbi:MAG: HAD family phosphatase [Chlamydiales bacterium]